MKKKVYIKMEIENIKDLKTALNNVPDEVLETFIIGYSEDDLALVTTGKKDEISNAQEYWFDCVEKYPVLEVISRFIENIIKEARNPDEPDDEIQITSIQNSPKRSIK